MNQEEVLPLKIPTVKMLVRTIDKLNIERKKIAKKGGVGGDTDARIGVFNGLSILNQNMYIGIKLIPNLGNDFFTEMITSKPQYSEEEREQMILDYLGFLFFGYSSNTFSHVEHFIRSLLKALDSSLYEKKKRNITEIYQSLLVDIFEFPPEEVNLLKILGQIRNSMFHSGGKFFPHNGKELSITWKGQNYHFIPNKIISFADPDFFMDRLSELNDLIIRITENEKVTTLSPVIWAS